MSQDEKLKWNRTYLEGRSHPHFEGDRSLAVDWTELMLPPQALALDLGCGVLRNSLGLAHRGHQVLAVDVAIEAFRHAKAWPTTLQPAVLDVDLWDIPTKAFDLVIMVHYLNRPKIPDLIRSVRPGGFIALEIRIAPELDKSASPPPFRLVPGELSELFPSMLIKKEETFIRGEVECIRAVLMQP